MSGCMGTDKDIAVSVIVLTYGDYSGLVPTLESILMQECSVQELLVSDDGSGKVFPSALVERYGGRVTFLQNAVNVGTVAHINAAVKRTSGEYIKIIASGDALYAPDSLVKLLRCAVGHHSIVTTSQAIVCNDGLQRRLYTFPCAAALRRLCVNAEAQFALLAGGNCVSAVGTLFHRDFFDKYGGFSEDYRLLEDWPAWLRETREGRCIGVLSEVTGLYAAGGVSSKEMDAYGSAALRQDMLWCYEREILPYRERLSPQTRRIVCYRYALLKDTPSVVLWRRWPLQQTKVLLKRTIKKWLMAEKHSSATLEAL